LTSKVKTQTFQIGRDLLFELRGFLKLPPQRGREALHLLFERLRVFLLRRRAHVAAGRKHMPVLADFLKTCASGEAWHVRILTRRLFPAPGPR
jgi:hypothetical protein